MKFSNYQFKSTDKTIANAPDLFFYTKAYILPLISALTYLHKISCANFLILVPPSYE